MERDDTRPEDDPTAQAGDDETPEEFAEDLESDPAYNPEDEMLKREKGG